VLAPATLAALPSTRAIPDRDVFYVAHPVRSIQLFRVSAFQFSAQLLTFPTFSLVPLQRFNSSTVQRFDDSKRHLKELRLDRKSVLPLLKKLSDGHGQSLLQ